MLLGQFLEEPSSLRVGPHQSLSPGTIRAGIAISDTRAPFPGTEINMLSINTETYIFTIYKYVLCRIFTMCLLCIYIYCTT